MPSISMLSRKPAILLIALAIAFSGSLAQAQTTQKNTAATQYKTEAEAKGHCASDAVVWVNPSSKVYHYAGSKDYGKTKRGAYACEKDAAAGGFRAAKGEKRAA